jgi:dihydrofolate reductase
MTTMRQIVTFDRVSADGYFTSADGDLSWVVPEPELDGESAAASAEPGERTLVFGRRTFEQFESFWPKVLDGAADAPDPHAPGERSPAMRAFATYLDAATKVVFSRTRRESAWRNTRWLPEIDRDAVEALKRGPGGPILVFGSGTVVSLLTELGLVDEYRLIVAPVLLGGGRPLVAGLPSRRPLELIEARAYPRGNVQLRYRPAR